MSNNSHKIEIIDFSDELKEPIKTLNYEWLEKYFSIEKGDVISLSNPREQIIEKGGFIFYAKLNDEIVGTASLLKKTDDIFELGKMAVTTKAQGYKIGTFALCRSHSLTKGVHDDGLAADIESINGKHINQASSKTLTLEVAKIIFELKGELAPKQIIIGGVGKVRSAEFNKYNRVRPGVEGTAAVNAFRTDTMQGHTNHIHVGY